MWELNWSMVERNVLLVGEHLVVGGQLLCGFSHDETLAMQGAF